MREVKGGRAGELREFALVLRSTPSQTTASRWRRHSWRKRIEGGQRRLCGARGDCRIRVESKRTAEFELSSIDGTRRQWRGEGV